MRTQGRWTVAAFAAAMSAFAPVPAAARPAPESFRGIVQQLSPTVVNIATVQAPGAAPRSTPLAGATPQARDKVSGGSAQSGAQSLGSGFIIDPAGFIVTNHHVIAGAQSIVVTLHDGQKLAASLVGADEKTDLALLKVSPRAPLPPVKFGDSDRSEVGDWVVAIGNPYGLGGSVSAGIVSARNRELNLGSYDDFIQTDAAINSGNSGGPLFNLEGEVVGVNSALLSPSGGSVGIGFAISANLARPIIGQLRSFGQARRGWIGVRVQSVTADLAEGLGLKSTRGALISNVTPQGPAEAAGLRAGDVVLSFDGRPIQDMKQFPRMVAESAIGRPVRAEVFRRGRTMTLDIPVQLLDDGPKRAAPAPVLAAAAPRAAAGLGLALQALTPELRQRFAIPMHVTGSVVTAVDPGGAAAHHDFRAGDVVVEAGQAPVAALADLTAAMAAARKAQRRFLLVAVSRRGETSFKALRVPAG